MQAGEDPSKVYPYGAFPLAFFTILGEYDYMQDVRRGGVVGSVN